MKIFALWDKGRENAPDTVRRCLDRWESMNPNYELVVLDRQGMFDNMPKLGIDPATLPIPAASDVLRAHLLATHGGVWTDATVMPMRPLDDWIEDYLAGSGMFFFSRPGRGRRVASWFIAARPGNRFMKRLDAEVAAFWDRPRTRERRAPRWNHLGHEIKRFAPTFTWKVRWLMDDLYPVRPEAREKNLYPYFWFHYLVGYLEEVDAEAREDLAAMTFRPGNMPHAMQEARAALSSEDFRRAIPFLLKAAPVQKLDWKSGWPDEVFVPPPIEEVSR